MEGVWGFSGQQRELLERKGLSMGVFCIVPRQMSSADFLLTELVSQVRKVVLISVLSWEFLNSAEVPCFRSLTL